MELMYENAFERDTGEWVMDGPGSYRFENGRLYIDCTNPEAVGGVTLWLNRPLSGDIRMTYETMAVEPVYANNLNFFLMACMLDGSPVTSAPQTGHYKDYHDRCRLYIGTFTGKWSRMRKDPGFVLLSENSRAVEPNRKYTYEINKRGHTIEWKVNGERFHFVTDPEEPYEDGLFGFRSWRTHLWVERFRIYSLR